MSSLAQAYDLVDEAAIPFGNDVVLVWGRIGLPEYQDHMADFFRQFETGGRRRLPTAEQIQAASKEGLLKLYRGGWKGDERNPVEIISEERIRTLLALEEFYQDVMLAVQDRKSYVRKRPESEPCAPSSAAGPDQDQPEEEDHAA